MLTYVGSMSLAALVPIVYASIGAVGVSLSASFEGNLAVNAQFTATPPTLSARLAAVADFNASLATAIGLGLPNISFDASASASLIADLDAAFGLLLSLEALLAASIGIYSYSYTGAGDTFGAAVTSALASSWPDGAPTNTSTNAFVFGAVASISQTVLAEFLDGLTFAAGLVYAGRLTLEALSSLTAQATTQGDAGISAQLAGALALEASLEITPPTLAADVQANLAYAASLEADGALAMPSVQFALDATADAAASLDAAFGLLIDLGATLARADGTVFVYEYSGLGNALGGELTAALATTWGDGTTPTSSACAAALLAATDSLTFTTMSAFFGGA